MSYPISSALIGLGTFEQVEAAMGWDTEEEEMEVPSFEEVLSTLEREYQPIPCDRCQRCQCPYGTEIHTIFRQYQYFFLGKDYWALKKLGMGIEESARHCRNCQRMPCLEMCPVGIQIPHELQKVEKLVKSHPVLRVKTTTPQSGS